MANKSLYGGSGFSNDQELENASAEHWKGHRRAWR